MLRACLFFFLFYIPFFSLPVLSANLKHNPECFNDYPYDKKKIVVNVRKTTGIGFAHDKSCRGKGLKIAYIDRGINLSVVEGKENTINAHSLAISSKDNQFSLSQIEREYNSKVRAFKKLSSHEQREKNATFQEEIKRLGELNVRKKYVDKINNYAAHDIISHPEYLHGTNILSYLSAMAPSAEIQAIDINLAKFLHPNDSWKTAFDLIKKGNPNVISLSCWPIEHNPYFVQGLTEVIQKGIPVIIGAGNDSSKSKPMFLNQERLPNGNIGKSYKYRVFESQKNRGLFLFVGALGYNIDKERKGEEKYCKFSQHPTKESLENYILAPGRDLLTLHPHKNLQYHPRIKGTSFAAPIVAAAYGLLSEYIDKKGLSSTPQDRLKILQSSGHDLKHNIAGTYSDSYKALNLQNAFSLADKSLKKRPPQIVKPQAPVKNKNVKQLPRQIAPKKAPSLPKKVSPIRGKKSKKPSPTAKGNSKSSKIKKKVISNRKLRISTKKNVKNRQTSKIRRRR